jgi:glycosyltransferase involved in cell wall biosynthesis
VNNNVDIMSWISQDELFRLYDTHDLLLFPSLHDSSGGVVLEALCHGMPVVCLDLGGPKEIVTPNSGVIIKTAGLNTAQVASRIADEIHALLVSPATLAKLSAGAISRAHDFLFPNRVAEFYREAQKFIEDRRGSSAPSVAQS